MHNKRFKRQEGHFNSKLIESREAREMTQQQLANELNYSRSLISKWESGDSLPDLDTIASIFKFFNWDHSLIKNMHDLFDKKNAEKAGWSPRGFWINSYTLVMILTYIVIMITLGLLLLTNVDIGNQLFFHMAMLPCYCQGLVWGSICLAHKERCKKIEEYFVLCLQQQDNKL